MSYETFFINLWGTYNSLSNIYEAVVFKLVVKEDAKEVGVLYSVLLSFIIKLELLLFI